MNATFLFPDTSKHVQIILEGPSVSTQSPTTSLVDLPFLLATALDFSRKWVNGVLGLPCTHKYRPDPGAGLQNTMTTFSALRLKVWCTLPILQWLTTLCADHVAS
jgi:hypothetical protein